MLKKKIFVGLPMLIVSCTGYYCYTKHKKYKDIINTRNSKIIFDNISQFLRNYVYTETICNINPYYSSSFNDRKTQIKLFWYWFFEENDFKKIPEKNRTKEMYKFARLNNKV